MKVTTALKNELAQWLDTYWTTYLKGDIATWATFIRDDYRNIGGTKEEIWNSKQEIIDYTNSILDQMIGTVEIRNRKIDVIPYGEYMMVHEFTDIYVKIEGEWILYGPFRMSSLLEKTDTGWIALHQHGSYPDMKALEGEAFSMDAIKAENVKLLEAVKSRTIELEIEAALERVRGVAMAMQKSEDILSVCKVMFQVLPSLGLKNLRNTLINFWDDTRQSLIDYDYSDFSGGNIARLSYSSHPVFKQFQKKIRSSKDAFAQLVVKKDQLESWKQRREESGEYEDPRLNNIDALYYYFYSIGVGAVGLSSFSRLSKENQEVLKRFRNVFDLAYRRYHDIEKAEAQAREAQIEAALERVRSRSMAMHKSEEFPQVIQVVFEQFLLLDFKIDSAQFDVSFRETDDLNLWTAAPGQPYPTKLHIPYADYEVFNSIKKAKKAGHAFVSIQLTKEEKNDFFNYFFLHAPNIPEERKKFLLSSPGVVRSAVLLEKVSLAIQNYSAIPYSDAEHNILKRFAKVFEQTYTRFLDLQKAEAQASEAKIEAALERVRSKTMAMHKSEQLPETAQVLFEQFAVLGKTPDRMSIGVYNEELGVSEWWVTDQEGIQIKHQFTAPLQEPTHAKMFSAWKEGKESIVIELEGDDLKEWVTFVRQVVKMPMDESRIKGRRVHQAAFFSQGQLLISSHEALQVETVKLLVRFAKVFSQTYTRFLDLQKAEAQAREAQIEASLERVRAKTMAMHNSEDVGTAIATLFTELDRQHIENVRCGIAIIDTNKTMEVWSVTNVEDARPEEGVLQGKMVKAAGILDMNAHKLWQLIYDHWKNKMDILYYHLFGKEKQDYIDILNTTPGYLSQPILEMPDMHCQVYFFNEGAIWAYSLQPHTDQQRQVMNRFTTVFSQTFLRYRDLQKAEAQAREAQIEAALERVRSRSLAMHHSDELLEAGEIIFVEMQKLGIESLTAGFVLMDKEEQNGLNYTPHPGTKKIMPVPVIIPHNETIHMLQVVENWKNGHPFFIIEMDEDETIKHQTFIAERSTNFPLTAAGLIAISPARLVLHNFYFKEGYVLIVGGEKLSVEQTEIMLRFAKVFQQTYTRFLDLQKAEAQAREAQIEASLERVRAHTMGMQSSNDLSNVASVMFNQMKNLGGELFSFAIVLCDKQKDMVEQWHNIGNEGMLPPFFVPVDLDYIHRYRYDQWKAGSELFSIEIPSSYITRHFELMFELPSVHAAMADAKAQGVQVEIPAWEMDYGASFRHGYLLISSFSPFKEDHIFPRFAKVFDQAYTRFLDLQKAEAQAREAQIESALERVRSKAMAMRTSEDIAETTAASFDELKKLGIFSFRSGVGILTKGSSLARVFADARATDGQLKALATIRNMEEHPALKQQYKAWELQDDYEQILSGDELKSYYSHAFFQASKINVQEVEPGKKECGYYFAFPDGLFYSWSYQPYTESEKNILRRFRNIIALTFRRFLELEKAESQAREAQIEAALERIRSRALAMHRSEEFSDVAKVMREQMGYLGQPELETSAVHLYDEDDDNIFSWRAFRLSSYLEGNIISGFFKIPKNSCAIAIEFIQKFNSNATEYTIEVSGEKQTEWYKILFKLAPEVEAAMKTSGTTNEIRHYHFSKFSGGALLMVSSKEPANDAIELQKRAAQVFDLAYRRFKDLQKAEAQALEAIKRASVDRVRAEIASMRTTSDLDRIQPLIWNELKTLDVPFIRCGVFIMDEAKQELQAFLSTPDGKSIAAFHLPYHSTDQSMQIVAHWQQKKIFRDHMDEKAFADYTKNLVQQGAVASDEKYVTENRPTDLYLHFLPFLQGMLYVGNDAALNDDELQLVQNLADAFSTAYARYEDFNKLDLAKTAVESAMSELKATQSQLVQQEKLASLGQLTAGIAHEIKNPLNFVNNFSEVSIELIDEVLQEIEKNQDTRDETLISDILKDIKSNVQKVHDHGYRANSIVTSMLQHSRGGTGTLHPTDLNALIKEYVNLSYHGMRASKTPIDVDIELNLDPALGMVSLIKEDFTRVVINLSNNAFDAMREKIKAKYEVRNTKYEGQNTKYEGRGTKDEGENAKCEEGKEHRVEYKPTLFIQTRLENGKVLIQFKDNGPGIPDEIMDKILQPFFTTKKGTEGTGLGLSITNDIVKAHGGELKVETKEGEGSLFIIQLPIV